MVGRDASIASGGTRAAPTKVVGDRVVPSGTTLELSLSTPIGSDTSAVDDTVDAVLRAPLVIDGEPILDAGAVARGIVTEATPSTKTDGRGRLTVRFDTIQLGPKSLPIHAAPVHWVARDLGRRAQEPRGFFQRILWKTKRGLHIGDDDNGPRGSAEVRFAPGTVLSIRVEQAARFAP